MSKFTEEGSKVILSIILGVPVLSFFALQVFAHSNRITALEIEKKSEQHELPNLQYMTNMRNQAFSEATSQDSGNNMENIINRQHPLITSANMESNNAERSIITSKLADNNWLLTIILLMASRLCLALLASKWL